MSDTLPLKDSKRKSTDDFKAPNRDYEQELKEKLPELKKIEGFPIGKDEDILALSDPPYYTACLVKLKNHKIFKLYYLMNHEN